MDSVDAMRTIVCTLCEGEHWRGTAVLINSLYSHGYRGPVYVGHKGGVPPWFEGAMRGMAAEVARDGGIAITTVPLSTQRHLAYFKADFLLLLIEQAALRPTDDIAYFDPDIVNKASWQFYRRWFARGVALCEDVNSPMYARHPLREEWREYFGLPGAGAGAEPNAYFNSGFVGLCVRDRAFLDSWSAYQDLAESRGFALTGMDHSVGSREELFFRHDQDFMNVAAMTYPDRLAPIGKEGMDFVHGGHVMSHAIGAGKPWNARYIKAVFRGRRPRLVDHAYWRNAKFPIAAHSGARRLLALLDLRLAAALGRLIA